MESTESTDQDTDAPSWPSKQLPLVWYDGNDRTFHFGGWVVTIELMAYAFSFDYVFEEAWRRARADVREAVERLAQSYAKGKASKE